MDEWVIRMREIMQEFYPRGLDWLSMYIYADDIAIVWRSREEVEACISNMEVWFKEFNLKINKKKSGIWEIRKQY